MSMLRMLQASTLAAAFLVGSAAFAAETGGTTEVSQTPPQQGRTARAIGSTSEHGQTTGPAQGTNVAPTKAPAAAGEPGEPGLPGNKRGPAVMPPKQEQRQGQ